MQLHIRTSALENDVNVIVECLIKVTGPTKIIWRDGLV